MLQCAAYCFKMFQAFACLRLPQGYKATFPKGIQMQQDSTKWTGRHRCSEASWFGTSLRNDFSPQQGSASNESMVQALFGPEPGSCMKSSTVLKRQATCQEMRALRQEVRRNSAVSLPRDNFRKNRSLKFLDPSYPMICTMRTHLHVVLQGSSEISTVIDVPNSILPVFAHAGLKRKLGSSSA